MDKFCMQCGNKLNEGNVFCGQCGKKVDVRENHITIENKYNVVNKKQKKIFIICIVILTTICIVYFTKPYWSEKLTFIYDIQNTFEKDNTPSVEYSSKKLSLSVETLKKKYLDSYITKKELAADAAYLFELKNLDDIEVYYNVSDCEYIGIKDNEIIFYGLTHISGRGRVKDFISDDFLDIEPAIYKAEGRFGKIIYLWKIDNGYIAIYGLEFENAQWYNDYVYSVVHIKDKDYLKFIEE